MPLTEETEGRLLAKLVRDLLRAESFESLADLTEALKMRCARLRIRWTNDGISEAFRAVASNAALVVPPAVTTRHVEPLPEPTILSHDVAVSVLAQLNARVRRMPAVERITARERDCKRAMAMVEQELVESLRRCDALERALEEAGR